MSETTWMREFYPVPAEDAMSDDAVAIQHSLCKWRGALPESLERHGLTEVPILFNGATCALCARHLFGRGAGGCAFCPLAKALRYENCNGPYREFQASGNPKRMIAALEKAERRKRK